MSKTLNDLFQDIGKILVRKTRRMERKRFNRTFALQTEVLTYLYKNPELSVKELFNLCRNDIYNLNEQKIEKVLKDYKLYEIEDRKNTISQACSLIENFYYEVRERDIANALESSEAIRSITFQRKSNSPDVKVRIFLIHLLELLKLENDYNLISKINKLQNALKRMGDVYSRKLFIEIFDKLSNYVGVGKERSLVEALSESVNDINQIISSSETDREGDINSEYSRQRDVLIVLSEQLDNIRNNFLAYQENAIRETKKNFFISINSDQYNNPLDTLAISDNLIKRLYSEGWSPEKPEVESVILAIKSLLTAFNSLGITPIYKIGEKIAISFSDISKFDYLGSELSGDEKKIVEVMTPGWKYNEEIISRPRVKEIQEG